MKRLDQYHPKETEAIVAQLDIIASWLKLPKTDAAGFASDITAACKQLTRTEQCLAACREALETIFQNASNGNKRDGINLWEITQESKRALELTKP